MAKANSGAAKGPGKLGIGGNLNAGRLGKISPPVKDGTVWKFPTVYLVDVQSIGQEIGSGERQGQTERVLRMDFSDQPKGKGGKKGFRALFWPVNPSGDEEKDAKNIETVQTQIKHIFDQFKTLKEDEYLGSGDTWEELFDSIAEAFNTGAEGQPIYGQVPTWLKLTYYRNNLQLPRFPNFIERKAGNFPQTLSVNLQYDTVEQTANDNPMGSPAGGGSPDDFPL